MISFYSVTKKFNKEVALRDISFDIEKGEFVFLAGVSGSGKSTLLRMLCKEAKPTEGSIYIFDRRINKMNPKKLRRRMGIVFQDYKLLNNKTILENVAYPLACLGVNPLKVRKRAIEALEKLQVAEFKDKFPEELSGGQQQRVAIARAIVTNPELLICDEPTGNLDMENTWLVMKHLQELNDEGTTIVMTTHNKEILEKTNKRIIRLHLGEMIEDTSDDENEGLIAQHDETNIQKVDGNKVNEKKDVTLERKTLDFPQAHAQPYEQPKNKKEKEMSILRELGWTEDDEKRFQKRYQSKKRKIEGGQ